MFISCKKIFCLCVNILFIYIVKGVWNSLQIHVPRRIVHFCNHVMELLYLNQDEVFFRLIKQTNRLIKCNFLCIFHTLWSKFGEITSVEETFTIDYENKICNYISLSFHKFNKLRGWNNFGKGAKHITTKKNFMTKINTNSFTSHIPGLCKLSQSTSSPEED